MTTKLNSTRAPARGPPCVVFGLSPPPKKVNLGDVGDVCHPEYRNPVTLNLHDTGAISIVEDDGEGFVFLYPNQVRALQTWHGGDGGFTHVIHGDCLRPEPIGTDLSDFIRDLEDAERTCKAANESHRKELEVDEAYIKKLEAELAETKDDVRAALRLHREDEAIVKELKYELHLHGRCLIESCTASWKVDTEIIGKD